MLPSALVALAALALQPAAAQPKADPKPAPKVEAKADAKAEPALVAFPHPLITEVYYAVGPGPLGDASGDGKRDANGDEFIELINPHDKPINLKGYTLAAKGPRGSLEGSAPAPDAEPAPATPPGKAGEKGRPANQPPAPATKATPPTKGGGKDKEKLRPFRQVRFTFPDCELQPGQVVVVFNGQGQTWNGPVGDAGRAPRATSPEFHNAVVFTMAIATDRLGLSNRADYVLLTAPDGSPVECVAWGDVETPKEAGKLQTVPAVTGESLQRRSATGGFEVHPSHNDRPYSPGVFPLPPAGAAPKTADAPAADAPAKPAPSKPAPGTR